MSGIIGFIEAFLAGHKKAIIMLLVLIAVVGGILGHRYYSYTRESPEFCATCHMMQESFRSWEMSAHRDTVCQVCHRLSVLEQNRLLVTYVATGYTSPQEQDHGTVEPWKACRTCHLKESQQGSISMRSSYGHAKHVFMEGIGCVACHTGGMHSFRPTAGACKACHEHKLVHGLGMESVQCLNCHSFGESTVTTVPDEKCNQCHPDVRPSGPMSEFHCFQCHKPHGRIKLKSGDCMGQCHGSESRVGQHGQHMEKAGLDCLDCHRPHTWRIGEAEAKGLCDRCHKIKPPDSFIY